MNSDQLGEKNSLSNSHRLPSLNALRCFEAAARWEHFTHAAQELHLTHGAISRAVRMLEEDLGVALFERRSQRVHLTDAGRQLALAVREGLNLMEQATHSLRQHAKQQRPWVLSCEPTLLMRWLIPRWPAFQQQHPDLQVHLVAGGGPFRFGDGIDMAIRRNDFPAPDSAYAAPLFAEKIGPVCRPDQAEQWFVQRSGRVTLSPNAPLLHTRTRPQAWEQWAALAKHKLKARNHQHFEHFYLSLQSAVAGLGVAIGSWHQVRDDLAQGLLVAPVGFVEDGSSYQFLTPQKPAANSPSAKLLAWLQSLA